MNQNPLDRVRQIVKTFGMVNCAPRVNRTAPAIDGCSNLLVDVFGDSGRTARSAVGMAELPFDIDVEIELVVEISDDRRAVRRRRSTRRSVSLRRTSSPQTASEYCIR